MSEPTKLHFIVNNMLHGKIVLTEDFYYECEILKKIDERLYVILGKEAPIMMDKFLVEMVNGELVLSCTIEIPTINMGDEDIS